MTVKTAAMVALSGVWMRLCQVESPLQERVFRRPQLFLPSPTPQNQSRRILGREVTLGLVSAFVTTKLDYCNSVLAGLPQATIDPLQRVQNAAARLVAGIRTRGHITPVLRSLHWLPIRLRIQYKRCVLTHLVRIGRSPAYLADMKTATADLPGRERLRSANSFPIRKLQNWSSSLVSGVSHTLGRRRGTHFLPISRN